MRRKERELKDRKVIDAMLERSIVGRIATINRKGVPVIKPVNFLYWDGKIYLHSSQEGEKIEDIQRGSSVCFEVDEPLSYVPAKGSACTASYYYRSVIVKGKGILIDTLMKKKALLGKLVEKYQPKGGYGEIEEDVLKKTALIEISIEEITGKENAG
jgi:nitroimidazol reductase NimA-like FMN-containing flavoprotein (pyridoxamine 5'-phosphate oxidase superfamily)